MLLQLHDVVLEVSQQHCHAMEIAYQYNAIRGPHFLCALHFTLEHVHQKTRAPGGLLDYLSQISYIWLVGPLLVYLPF